MEPILETTRLRLRPFTLADTDFILRLLNSPGWLRFIGDRNVRSHDDAVAYLENGPLKSYRTNGFGLSMVETKDASPVGMCGVLKRDTMDHPDIGFAFLPEWSGQGFAYEIAAATLAHARSFMGLHTIDAITLPDNERSIRLLERLGLQRIGTLPDPTGTGPLLHFRSHLNPNQP